MRKYFIHIFTVLLILVLLPLNTFALTPAPQEDMPEDDGLTERVRDLTLTWKEAVSPAPNSVFLANWTDAESGEKHEMCIVGLPRMLTEEEVLLLIRAGKAGVAVDLEDNALTDAEKFTNKLSGSSGNWVVQREGNWDDSHKCWAAAASNMLWLTGWPQRAVDPDTGAAFASEDEVFSYIAARVANDGSWHPACVKWFFTGQDIDNAMPLTVWDEVFPVLLPGEDPAEYLITSLTDPPEFSETVTPDVFTETVRALSAGAAGGINVSAGAVIYSPLPGTPYEDETICFDNVTERYTVNKYDFGLTADSPDLEQTLYTYNTDGTVRKVVKTQSGYADESGAPVDALWVLDGYIHTDPESGLTVAAILEPNCDEYSWSVDIAVSEDMVDTRHPRHHYIAGHSHALTLTGYIINTTRGETEALFIADSDDSAEYFVIDETVSAREDRPNIYRFCPVAYHPYMEDETCMELMGYLPGRDTVLSDITVLYPPEAPAGK